MSIDILNRRNYINNFDIQLKKLTKMASESAIYYKHAAALIVGNNIYSIGVNKFIGEMKDKNNKSHYKTMHAEINVFENFSKKNVRGMDILVIRVNKNSALKNSRPCNQCIDKLQKIGIRKVFYSDDDGYIVSEHLEYMEKRHISSGTRHLLYRL